MKKLIIGCVFILVGLVNLLAQEKVSFLNFSIGGGFHNLQYELKNGSQMSNPGYTFNAGYNYFFSSHWGITTGFAVQSFQSESNLTYLSEIPSVDSENESYIFRTYYKYWTEKQSILMFDIPIGLSYISSLKTKWKTFATFGVKISLPMSDDYEIIDGEIETRGYYPQYDVELYDMPQHNFTTINGLSKQHISLKPVLSSFLDVSILYQLKNNYSIYFGAYAAYSINNLIVPTKNELYQQDGTYNGVFLSNQTERVLPVSVGMRVGLNIAI